jgi:hypothetical protein
MLLHSECTFVEAFSQIVMLASLLLCRGMQHGKKSFVDFFLTRHLSQKWIHDRDVFIRKTLDKA